MALPWVDWKFCAEVEKFPSTVMAARHPGSVNLGDVTAPDFIDRAKGILNGTTLDLLVFGSPCQGFSVAGKRLGLDDPRSNLALHAIRIARELAPTWILFENVPGMFSSWSGAPASPTILGIERAGGAFDQDFIESSDFAEFLRHVSDIGYFGAWTILDAQYFGLAQRRKRVFFVGRFGDWRGPAAVLLEPESLCGNYPPSREARKNTAPTLSARTKGGGGLGTDFDLDGGLIAYGGNDTAGSVDIAPTIRAGGNRTGGHRPPGTDVDTCESLIVAPLTGNPYGDNASRESLLIAHSLRGDGFDASEDGTGRGTPLVAIPILEAGARTGKSTDDIRCSDGIGADGDPMFTLQRGKQHAVAFTCKDHGADAGDLAPTLRSMGHDGSHANGGGQVAVAFNLRGRDGGAMPETTDVASIRAASGGSSRSYVAASSVRRLTPRECERLQGFPDDYTALPKAADGPRYRSLGNSMAVPVISWIGNRIRKVVESEA